MMDVMAKRRQTDPHVAKLRAALDRDDDLTHQQLADKLSVSIVTLRAWLYGQREPSRLARKVIDNLKL